MYTIQVLDPVPKVEVHDLNKTGVFWVETTDTLCFYTDVFRSVPLFIASSARDRIIHVFSDFRHFYALDGADRAVDKVGFWEILLFGAGIGERTLYSAVKQVPAAAKVEIDRHTGDFRITPTWNYAIHEDTSITSAEEAAERLHAQLRASFAKLDPQGHYLLGMSGGLDSRITLALLSECMAPEQITLFTYGFDKRILEYQYACEVAQRLGFRTPEFFQLEACHYLNAKGYLPKMAGGQMGINHCHILEYLRIKGGADAKQISTYYSDAILGWDAQYPKHLGPLNINPYYDACRAYGHLEASIEDGILQDALSFYKRLDNESNFSSLSEFKYVTERNPKFHVYMIFLHGKMMLSLAPYCDKDLLDLSLAIPLKFRAQKKLIDIMIKNYYSTLQQVGNISSRFMWGSGFGSKQSYYLFRFLNGTNGMLRYLTKGRFELLNKYQTEDQDRLLRRDFSSDLKIATQKFLELGLITLAQKQDFDKIPMRSTGISERYNLITLSALL